MPQSLSRVVLHVVFSTKNRVPFLKEPSLRSGLHAYMAGTLQNLACDPLLINGVEDHVHILCNFSRTLSMASMIEEVKTTSSKWVKKEDRRCHDFFWQSGYGIFSVSQSNVDQARAYIAAQEEHHRKASFQDEFRLLCEKHGIVINERYAWD